MFLSYWVIIIEFLNFLLQVQMVIIFKGIN